MNALEWAPLARITDPSTSHEAAREQIASGRRETHAYRVYAALRSIPNGMTFSEVAEVAGISNPVEACRRLSDLRDARLAYACGKRRCAISGRTAQLWFLCEEVAR